MPRKKKADSSTPTPKAAPSTSSASPESVRDRFAEAPRLKIVGLNSPESEPEPKPGEKEASGDRHWSRGHDDLGDPYFQRSTRLLDFLLAVILCAGAILSVILTYRGIGHSWDEALYLRPAASAGQWIIDLCRGKLSLLEPAAIDQAWGLEVTGEDPLHPEVAPVPKTVIGLGLSLLTGYGVSEMHAMRLPIALFFGLTVALLYIVGARTFGRLPGFIGATAYWLMPRVFGHAHIAASETLFAFAVVFLTWAYLAAIKRPWLSILTAIAFGLAFDTKVTALCLPLALLVWGQLYYRRDYASNIFAMSLGSPLVAFALWPWLWWDPLTRLAEYVKFYAAHQRTAVFYMGQMWGYVYGPPAPWHYPFVITAIGVPAWTLLLIILGMLAIVGRCRKRPVPMLYLMLAATLVGVCALPNAPKYDGERLFFGAFPFLALIAAGGFDWVWSQLCALAEKRRPLAMWGCRAWVVLAFLMIGWNIRTIKKVHPDELNFFNSLVGGAKGAYEKGFETAYWGEAVNEEVIDYLNSLTKPGTKFKPLALNELVFLNLQGWGLLSGDGIYVAANEPYDYYVLQVRQGFFGNRERALHFGAKPLRVFEAQGVPKIEIFSGDALTTQALLAVRMLSAAQNLRRADDMPLLVAPEERKSSATLQKTSQRAGATTAGAHAAMSEQNETSQSREKVELRNQNQTDQDTTSPQEPSAKKTSSPPKEASRGQEEMQLAL